MNNKNIKTCRCCRKKYCLECSDPVGYRDYCSRECEIRDTQENNLDEQHRKLTERGEDVL